MFSRHPFFAIWFVSSSTATVFHRRGSANDSTPYSNVTSSSTVPAHAASRSDSVLLSSSSSPSFLLQAPSIVLSSDYGFPQPTGAGSSVPSDPATRTNTTSLASDIMAFAASTPLVSQGNATSGVPGIMANATSSDAVRWINATSPSIARSNATCTVHIPNASIDWWYPPTYSHLLGTMTTKAANFSNADSYTLVPHTATFDAAAALTSDFVCTSSESYISEYDFTATYCMEYTEKPTVARTALAYRTAAAPFPPGGIIPVSDARFYDLYTDGQPVATTSISIAPNRTFIESSATPFVHFTAYEIELGNRTQTVELSSAQVFPYSLKELGQDITATGPLPEEFLQQIPQSDCDAGMLQATVTVVIVVDLYYQNWPNLDPFIVHFESTALGFDDDPVVINNEGTSRGVPLTLDDWDLPGVPAKTTTPASIRPNIQVDPTPTTQAGSNNNNNNNNNQGTGSNGAQVPNVSQPTSITVGNVGTIPVVIGPSSVVVIGSQTLQPGGPAVIVGGVTPVSLVPSGTAIVFGGTTSQLPQIFTSPIQDPGRAPPVLTIGSSTLTPNAATQFFIAPGQTLTPGGTAVVDGTRVSLAPSASFVVIGSTTQFLPVVTSPAQIIIGGSTILALPSQGAMTNPSNNMDSNQSNPQNSFQNDAGGGPTFVVSGQTLAPGGQAITVSETTISLAPGGSSIIVNGVTSTVQRGPPVSQPTITVGNSVFSPLSGSGTTFVIADQTLAPGGQAITVSGTVLSLAPSASFVLVNGVTSILANAAAAQITAAPVLTIGNGIFRPLAGTGTSYLIGSQILVPGGVVVIADTTISLASGATALIVNGRTSIINPLVQPALTNAPLLTIGSRTYTAVSGTTFIIAGQTLTPGGVITVDGTTIRLAPDATELVYGSSGHSTSTALFPATTTQVSRSTPVSSLGPSASGSNGQAAATGNRQNSAPPSRLDGRSLLCLGCALIYFLF